MMKCSARSQSARRTFYLTLTVFWALASGYGSRFSPLYAERLQVRIFDQADGLSNLTIYALQQQTDGHLWVATDNGLFRYDGSVFREFGRADGLSDPSVYSVHIDRNGTVWAGTHTGLFRFDGQRFSEVLLDGHHMRVGVNSMLGSTSAGELIVETSTGIRSVEADRGGNWTAVPFWVRHPQFTQLEDTDGIAVDLADRLWFGCQSRLCLWDGNAVRVLGAQQGVPEDFYVSLYVERSGRIWARGRKHIVSWLPGDAVVEDRTGSFPAGGEKTVARRFAEDKWGRVLTPTAKGFVRWDHDHWEETLRTNKGTIDGASELFSDSEGNLWIGTEGFGLLESRGYGYWHNYGTAEGLSNPAVLAIAVDGRNRYWIGNGVGSNLLDAAAGKPTETIRPSPLDGEKDGAAVVSLAASPDGGMWAATVLGQIYHVNGTDKVDAHFALDAYIDRILLDHFGRLWIGTSKGLFTLETKSSGAPEPISFTAAGTTNVSDMVMGKDGDLLTVGGAGLSRIEISATTLKLTHIAIEGLDASLTKVAQSADGSVWVAGKLPGMLRVRIEGGTAKIMRTYVRPEIASDLITFLGVDTRDRLWAGTDHGVNVIDGGRTYLLTEEDGLIWNICSDNGFRADSDGSVWIGTSLGVSHLPDADPMLHRPGFATTIETARYGTSEIVPGSKLKWNRQPMAVHFSALTFRDNQSLLYHYRLDGLEAEPIETSTPIANFQNLAPGSYTLHVTAEDREHHVFSSPATLTFTLTAPWWRTEIFYGCLIVVMLGLLALTWRWRHLALLAQQHKLERLVEERTHELKEMALRDALTGLLNRGAICSLLNDELERVKLEQCELGVAILDLDYFKQVNDGYGHLAGDEVLRQAAQRLAAAVRNSDSVGRYGGEEFLVIFRNTGDFIGAVRCEELRRCLCELPIRYHEHDLEITCSIGFAHVRRSDLCTTTELLAHADGALYVAKEKGRNRTEVFAPHLPPQVPAEQIEVV